MGIPEKWDQGTGTPIGGSQHQDLGPQNQKVGSGTLKFGPQIKPQFFTYNEIRDLGPQNQQVGPAARNHKR